MELSDRLAKLAARAQEAQTRTAAARDKAKAEIELDVAAARAAAQGRAHRLQQTADATKSRLSDAWNSHVATIRETIDDERDEQDLQRAKCTANDALDDAEFAIDFAYSAIEAAEYAVLDAHLARMEADELAEASGTAA
jgi:hypothetical protein